MVLSGVPPGGGRGVILKNFPPCLFFFPQHRESLPSGSVTLQSEGRGGREEVMGRVGC